MLFCKVCSLELTSNKRTRLKLKGNAVGINDVCSELFDSLMKKYTDHPFSSFHSYLSDEPAFVCKSCFSVSITRTVSGDTHTIIEGSLPARRWSKTVGRRAFVCKSCFSVSITRTVSGDTHTIIEGSLPARRWSKTVGRRAKQYGWQRHKHVSPANKLFYSLLLLVFQALQAECLYCCVDSGIDLLFAGLQDFLLSGFAPCS